ncbi:hypothetical protein Asulf_00472 [Archaeoglobus sulfaticallidus PM70-1]|uniref:S-layer domain protein n=1 Tax=Archaeoglobus sulfaticallidus PM70-1 TaxID=387631 RepID=N0BA89_9EURY|nr:hypothetical protein [Archaeoglobus sulfaticallidus]AGK60499.1 hypothetical protein Asulf_00472 [Archaeoglobus sulfaticallidus PM70-1]
MKGILRFGMVMFILLLLMQTSSALMYEEKPNIKVSVAGSNYFSKGEEKYIMLTVFNGAKKVKIDYFNDIESMFFDDGSMLFIAYNVTAELEGCDGIVVETPPQKIPALKPMTPLNLQYLLKVDEGIKPGEYNLKLKVTFERISDLSYFNILGVEMVPSQFTNTMTDEYSIVTKNPTDTNVTLTNTTVYQYKKLIGNYKLLYEQETQEIPIKIYVKEDDVKLEVVEVKGEDLIGGGKGKIEIKVRNSGEKTARNAYLVLEAPSGFEPSALSMTSMSSMPSSMTPMAGMPSGLQMGLPSGMPTGMSMAMPSAPSSSLPSTQAAYFVGELKPNETTEATFYIKINVKDGGRYPLKVRAVYVDANGDVKETEAVPFGIDVQASPVIEIKDVKSNIYVNAKGELRVTFTTSANLSDASVLISANPPLSVLSSEYYIGNIEKGKEYTAIFKLKASGESKPVRYPVKLYIKYRALNEYAETDEVSVGVKVNPKLSFEVLGTPSIQAGTEKVVTFKIVNTGDFEIKDANARITIVDPFTSTDDTSFIGDLKPNESKEVRFKIKVDSDATPKIYALNLEVKYKDLEGEWVTSEPAKALIDVKPSKPPYMLYGVFVLVALVAIGAYVRSRKK